jgi:penicillin amidase
MRRTLALLFGVLAVVVLGGPPAAWIWAERSVPPRAATARIEGLSAPARVIRDRNGVAHVFAATIEDAMAAQGFVHAQDRFAQMDAMRLVARGRLAELVGAPGVASDRFMRGLDLRGRAERALDAMSPENRRALDAYARGVNRGRRRGRSSCASPAVFRNPGCRSIPCSGARSWRSISRATGATNLPGCDCSPPATTRG